MALPALSCDSYMSEAINRRVSHLHFSPCRAFAERVAGASGPSHIRLSLSASGAEARKRGGWDAMLTVPSDFTGWQLELW